MKLTFLSILAIALMTALTGCDANKAGSNGDANAAGQTTDTLTAEHSGEHIYTCPMGCEGSTSNKPGKCPVCGMDLEHTDAAGNGKKYRMDFSSTPTELEANKAAVLRFTPREEGNDKTQVPLDVVHEKKLHLIIVSKDLSYFEHIHPEYAADGSLQINVVPTAQAYAKGAGHNETKFEYGGDYLMFTDYNPSGSGHQLARIPVTLKGKEKPAVKYTKENLTWSKDGYTVKLSFDKSMLTAKQSTMLTTTVTKNGKPVTDIDHYLGALGHMVVISEDTEKYLHVHPLDSEKHGPDIAFHSSFADAGMYRVFLQFKHDDKVHSADFVINVNEASAGTASQETNQDAHSNH